MSQGLGCLQAGFLIQAPSRSAARRSVRGARGACGHRRLEGSGIGCIHQVQNGGTDEIVHQIEMLVHVDAEDVEPVDMERIRAEEDEFWCG